MARQKLSEVILEDLKKKILTGEYRRRDSPYH